MSDRRKWLGGSDIASVFGVSPWKSALELYEEKTAEVYEVPVVEPEREKLYRRGKKLEPWVMELLEEERGITIFKKNQRYSDDEFPWMACEVDFEFVNDLGSICNGEVKTVNAFAAGDWGEQGTDDIPLYYCLQTLWGLMIKRERPMALVGALIGADDLRVYEVQRDDELIAEMRKRALVFWNEHVIPRIPPPPQTNEDANRLLRSFNGFISVGSPEMWAAISRLKGLRKAVTRLEEKKKQYEYEIKKALLTEAVASGVEGQLDKMIINGADGKKMATLALQKRAGYAVDATECLVLRT